jgi:hypothetical protein
MLFYAGLLPDSLLMEATCSSGTLADFQWTTHHYILEDKTSQIKVKFLPPFQGFFYEKNSDISLSDFSLFYFYCSQPLQWVVL